MSVTITDDAILSSHSPHWAWPDRGSWVVSWLDQPVGHHAAVTALHLAELHSGSPHYQQMGTRKRSALATMFAAELDLTREQAAARIHASEQQAQNLRASEHSSAVGEDW